MKNIQYLINIIWSEEDGCYIAEVPELEGCITHGKTPEQALKNSKNATESWISAAKALQHPIPQPVLKKQVSGKFNVRLPKHLHKSLVVKAAQEGASLNQLVTTIISHAV